MFAPLFFPVETMLVLLEAPRVLVLKNSLLVAALHVAVVSNACTV